MTPKFYLAFFLVLLFQISLTQKTEKEDEKKEDCPPGTMKVASGGCGSCSINYYNPTHGGSCQACPSGTSSNIASSKCEPCGEGTIGTGAGKGCSWCPIDHFSSGVGSTGPCRLCPKGSEANSARTACDYYYDYRYYHNVYILDSESGVPGTTKAALSNFRMFYTSMNYDFKPKDFSSEVGTLLKPEEFKVGETIGNLLKEGQLFSLTLERTNPDILRKLDQVFKNIPNLSGKEAAEWLKYTRFYGGAASFLDKASTTVGFVTAIGPKMYENMKNKEKFSKFLGDFVTDSTKFFVMEAAESRAAIWIARTLFAGAALETAGVCFLIAGGVALLPDDLVKINGKTPTDYFREFMGQLTSGLGDEFFQIPKEQFYEIK
jgi:hypothetical protein